MLHSCSRSDLRRGFSLLELLVVLAIMSAVLSGGILLVRGHPDGARMRLITQSLSSLLQEARVRAIEKNQVVPILLLPKEGRIAGPTPKLSLQLDGDLRVQFIGSRPTQQKSGAGSFRFFPDGSSSGGKVILQLHNQVSRLTVDWMTGAVETENDEEQ